MRDGEYCTGSELLRQITSGTFECPGCGAVPPPGVKCFVIAGPHLLFVCPSCKVASVVERVTDSN